MKKNQTELGLRIQRLFLLSIIFGVLWVKEYLWCAFFLAGLLYFGETLIAAMLQAALNASPEPTPRRRTRRQREMMPPTPAWTSEDAEGPPVEGGADFREPPPSRPAPRRKGS